MFGPVSLRSRHDPIAIQQPVPTVKIIVSNDVDRIRVFLTRHANSFVPPLHGRVDITERAEKLARSAVNLFLVDEVDEADIGHVAFYEAPDAVRYVTSFCVDAARHGRGHAGLLVEELVRQIARAGGGRIELEVFTANTRARSFYVRHGFACVWQNETKMYMVYEVRLGS